MCVAIAKPVGLLLDEETLTLCFKANPDGAGFAYLDSNNVLQVEKFMELAPFMDAYIARQEEYKDSSPFLIHFRIKTHGQKNIDNCHPFKVDEDHVFIHNGVIRNVPDCPDKEKSDTRMFKELILRNLPEGWFYNKAIKELLEEYISSFSKVVVMNSKGELEFYNEDKGTWYEGIWFSNMYWQTKDYSYYQHADYCLNCNTYIKYNIYSNKNNVSYCSTKCKEEFWKRGNKEEKCIICNRRALISIFRDKLEYHYCSDVCRTSHAATLRTKVTNVLDWKNKQTKTYIECCYCGNMEPSEECIAIEICYGKHTEQEKICYKCIPNAIDIGYIQETEELLKMVEEIRQEVALSSL